MEKEKKGIRKAQALFEKIIEEQIDKQIDRVVDSRFEEINEAENKHKNTLKENNKQEKQASKNKFVFSLSYFVFFIALIFEKSSDAKFYANQGLVLLIFTILGGLIFNLGLAFINLPLSRIISLIFYCLAFLLAVFGFVQTMLGEKETTLPLIGKIKIIK